MGKPEVLKLKLVKSFTKSLLVLIGIIYISSCIVATILFPHNIPDIPDIPAKLEFINNFGTEQNTGTEQNAETERKIETGRNAKIEINTEYNVCALIKVLIIPLIIFLLFLLILLIIFLIYFKVNKSPCNKCEEIIKLICQSEDTLRKIQKTGEEILETQKNKEPPLNNRKIEMIGEVCLEVAKTIKPDSEKGIQALHNLLKDIIELSPNISSGEDKNGSKIKELSDSVDKNHLIQSPEENKTSDDKGNKGNES